MQLLTLRSDDGAVYRTWNKLADSAVETCIFDLACDSNMYAAKDVDVLTTIGSLMQSGLREHLATAVSTSTLLAGKEVLPARINGFCLTCRIVSFTVGCSDVTRIVFAQRGGFKD